MVGEPVAIATGVMYDVAIWRAGFSVSEAGHLTFHTGTAGREIQMKKVDRSGRVLGEIGDPWSFGNLRVSPDGQRVVPVRVSAQDLTFLKEPSGHLEIVLPGARCIRVTAPVDRQALADVLEVLSTTKEIAAEAAAC
jgi:hypothetical protein